MKTIALPGLDRLLGVCQRRGLKVMTTPPGPTPPLEGTQLEGHPLDPMLTAFYSRFGRAVFAPESAGMGLFEWDERADGLETQNRQWQQHWQEQLPLPLFVFGGESGLAHYYATVPEFADAEGHQPVLRVNTYEDPYALPIASNVDRFFDTYSRYLEALVTHPDYDEERGAALIFPWGVPHLLARDERLVALMRAGHFDPVLPKDLDGSVRRWVAQVVGAQS